MLKNVDQHLSCGEVSNLWMNYQYESIQRCGITSFLQHVDDEEIEQLLRDTLDVTNKRLEQTKELFSLYNHLLPQAFSDLDVNLEAPRLFTDELYLQYLLKAIELETTNYNLAMQDAINTDIMDYYNTVIPDSLDLQMRTKRLSKQKDVYIPAPSIPKQTQIEFVKKDSFLSGWFGDKRPLIGIEIAQLVEHAKHNSLGQAVITAFSQVAKSKEIRRYFERGREISGKHLDIFTDALQKEYLPNASHLLTSEVTDSQGAPFSDKLMTVFITSLITFSIAEYGTSIAMNPRRDLSLMYTRLIGEIANYSNDGAEILIKNGWMEQPPIAADRKDLAR